MNDIKKSNMFDKSREHLANERTFLAWIRTGIALIGLGFVIVKFTLFLRQLSLMFETTETSSGGYSSLAGLVIIAMGIIIVLFAFFRYRNYKNQLNKNTFYSSSTLLFLLTLIILAGGVILIIYLLPVI